MFHSPIHCVSHQQLIFNQDKLPYQLSTGVFNPAFFPCIYCICDSVLTFSEKCCAKGCRSHVKWLFGSGSGSLFLTQLIILIKTKLSRAMEILEYCKCNTETLLNVSTVVFKLFFSPIVGMCWTSWGGKKAFDKYTHNEPISKVLHKMSPPTWEIICWLRSFYLNRIYFFMAWVRVERLPPAIAIWQQKPAQVCT